MKIAIYFNLLLFLILKEVNCLESTHRVQDNEKHFNSRSRKHFQEILNKIPNHLNDDSIYSVLNKLMSVYRTSIKPLEDAYHYNDIKQHVMNEGELYALPMVVFLGPWSTGKSSLINYLLSIENSSLSLTSGAQPTTSDFTVLSYGQEPSIIEGKILAMEWVYSSLEKYGHNFLERLRAYNIQNEMLKMVNLVDTPGFIENRKQQQRGYPFTDICQWFINRADLIVLVFDPTKLDVGVELDHLFKQIQGNEAKLRIVLNKADTIDSWELMHIYGSLFWRLSPLLNVTEPPKVYVGSFWSKSYHSISQAFQNMFIHDEVLLLQDIFEVMSNRLLNKIAYLRKHALLVRNHALLVDGYLAALSQHRSLFFSSLELAKDIVNNPDTYRVHQKIVGHRDIDHKDLFSAVAYKDFFTLHAIDSFLPLSKHCGFLSSCLLDIIEDAIYRELPFLVAQESQNENCNVRQMNKHYNQQTCLANSKN